MAEQDLNSLIDVLRFIARIGWLSLTMSVGWLIYTLSSEKRRRIKKRFYNAAVAVFLLIVALIILDFNSGVTTIRIVTNLCNILFLYSFSSYLLYYTYYLNSKVPDASLDVLRAELDKIIYKMKHDDYSTR